MESSCKCLHQPVVYCPPAQDKLHKSMSEPKQAASSPSQQPWSHGFSMTHKLTAPRTQNSYTLDSVLMSNEGMKLKQQIIFQTLIVFLPGWSNPESLYPDLFKSRTLYMHMHIRTIRRGIIDVSLCYWLVGQNQIVCWGLRSLCWSAARCLDAARTVMDTKSRF